MKDASAIYEPMLEMGWVGDRPTDYSLAWSTGAPVPTEWSREVVCRVLPCGIEVRAQRRGLTIYDFERWSPGVVVSQGEPGLPRTVRAVSEAAKPALINRLRVINSHLTLLHATAMLRLNESPAVVRVHERDLYRHDYPEGPGDGYWYRKLSGTLPTHITIADRQRFGSLPINMFEESLEWLEQVIQADALIEFDLLNQIQEALATHDYALAVVAGWTICELRARALARVAPRVKGENNISKVCEALVNAGLMDRALFSRLDRLRSGRNKWLHNGVEPSEEIALEALLSSTELLKCFVPKLITRAGGGIVLL